MKTMSELGTRVPLIEMGKCPHCQKCPDVWTIDGYELKDILRSWIKKKNADLNFHISKRELAKDTAVRDWLQNFGNFTDEEMEALI